MPASTPEPHAQAGGKFQFKAGEDVGYSANSHEQRPKLVFVICVKVVLRGLIGAIEKPTKNR